jgi:predicted RNA-binding protein with PIN domain
MNYLIDGHNLIGKMDGIKLSDPDDEAKLVLRLLNWAAVGKNRRVIVVFDGGVHGVNWSNFASDRVRVVFVPEGRTADDWLIRFMRQEVKNVREFHLVSSDNQIIKQAENRRIPVSRSEAFAAEMAQERGEMAQMGEAERTPLDKPVLNATQVDAWLLLFGGEPELTIRPYEARPVEEPAEESAELSEQPAAPGLLSPREVSEWLELFGGEPKLVTTREATTRSKRVLASESAETRRVERNPNTPKVADDSPVSQDDVDLWYSLFGE